jgi:beta-lactam-binding protein with PASTA domain/tRNA A-37 threonylcarbamoyl transferase component Bud32
MAHTTLVDLIGRVLNGRYRLLAPIGAGASARVYLADDVRLRRRVAVKVLHNALGDDGGFQRRFRAEAQMAAALHHPHVMAVYDWGEDDGIAFMVVELLKGGSLRSLLDAGDHLTPEQAAHVGRQVAAALAYAHGRGIVHRDIKPANLLFDAHGIVRVADFGIARALAEASWTEPAGSVVGTTRYAAPEQVGGTLDGRADLYSLAIVLVEACTGEVPVVGDTAIGTLAARAHRPIVAPEVLGPLAPVISRAGQPDPTDRYPDAGAMGAALAAAARVLPAPESLDLPGLDHALDDLDRTQHPPDTRFFDQDVPTASRDVPTDAVELAVPVRRRSTRTGMRKSWVPVVAGIAIVVALVAGVAALVGASAGGGPTVAVPALVGLTETEAAARATDAGLLMRVVERRTFDDPEHLVVEQHPGTGAFLAQDEAVEVVVSRGPPPAPLPDVTGQPAADAQAALEAASFVVALERRYDENVPRDVALGTEPAGGGKAPRESTVTLIVSDGPEPVPVPDVAGLGYDDAAAALQEKRLVPVQREAYSDTVEQGKVIGTDPAVGQPAPRDSEVGIIVSLGPEIITVPNVTGASVEAASETLRAAGLVPDVQNYSPGARVRAQDPSGGAEARRGSKITLFL